MKVLLVEPGKEARPFELKNELHEMQRIVGGLIQAIYPWEEPVALVCNDEGKMMGLPFNRMLGDYDVIAGTFFVCGIEGENFCGLTEEQMRKYQQMFLSPEQFLLMQEGIVCIRTKPAAPQKSKKPTDYER